MSTLACPECGARLAQGAERCDLCGASVPRAEEAPGGGGGDIPEPETGFVDPDGGVYCSACGQHHAPDANFCSRCGAPLHGAAAVSPSAGAARRPFSRSAPPGGADAGDGSRGGKPVEPEDVARGDDGSRAEAPIGRHVSIIVGMSVLVVIALYMITVISKQRVETSGIDRAAAPADIRSAAVIDEVEAIPIGERFAPTVDSLRAVIAADVGEDAYSTRRELVAYLIDIGRIDRAAVEQQRLARETDQVDDWRRAGDLLYDWMESVNAERKTDVALLTIDAYERVLEETPDDLDVRADLGWAYQYDPQNPMEAIQHTNQVLAQEPDHLAANYNRGVFLLRINRVEDAAMQFERVVELADEGSLYARQAQAWIRTIEEQQAVQP